MVINFLSLTLSLTYSALTLAIIFLGWSLKDQRYFIAESGIGYWLGIFGALMMLMLLVYPLRKRKPRWNFMGSIKFWFRFHMFLGVYGPIFILYHSGFQLGSLNSNVALFSMIIVASSGLIGRYLYRRIHHGLYGSKIKFEELFSESQQDISPTTTLNKQQTFWLQSLEKITESLTNKHTGINRSLSFYLSTKKQLKQLKKELKHALFNTDDQHVLSKKIHALTAICRLGVHEIFFSYWHILHVPLFIILVLSGITHVVVVHFY